MADETQQPETEGQGSWRPQQEEAEATAEDKAEQKREDEQGPEVEGQTFRRSY